ncbi:MAG: hypothetical protein GX567_19680, partial [Clostridia bacterium]|nr:hypothetical protein [Clostridia bacterium]
GTLGVAGFRVDAPQASILSNWRRKGFPSINKHYIPAHDLWNPARPRYGTITDEEWADFTKNGGAPALEYDRASQATIHGGISISRSVREGIRTVCPQAVTVLETHAFPLSKAGDASYDVLFRNLPYKYLFFTPEDYARLLAQWLDEQPYTDVENVQLMRNIVMNDDTVAHLVAGNGLMRPLFGLMYFAKGFPLGYSGQDFGHAEFLRRLNQLRSQHPVLRRGEVTYASQGSRVAIHRVLGTDSANILLNFDQPFEVSVTINGIQQNLEPDRPAAKLTASGIALAGNQVKADHYTLNFDPATGLPEKFDIVSHSKFPVKSSGFAIRKEGEMVIAVNMLANGGELLFACTPSQVTISASGKGYAVVLDESDMYRWQAAEHSALLEDWVSPAFAAAPLMKANYHTGRLRIPEVDGLLYNARIFPLAPNCQEIRFFPREGTGMAVAFPGASPLVELYRQYASEPGLHVVWTPDQYSNQMVLRPEGTALAWSDLQRTTSFGFVTLTSQSSRLILESPRYQVVLSRAGGAILEITDKENKQTFKSVSELELSPGSGAPLRMYYDHESALQIIPTADGVKLRYAGGLRNGFKSAPQFPVHYVMEYAFGEDGFTFNATVRSAGLAFAKGTLRYKTGCDDLKITGTPGPVFPLQDYAWQGAWNAEAEQAPPFALASSRDLETEDVSSLVQ